MSLFILNRDSMTKNDWQLEDYESVIRLTPNRVQLSYTDYEFEQFNRIETWEIIEDLSVYQGFYLWVGSKPYRFINSQLEPEH